MKTILLASIILCSAAAFGQATTGGAVRVQPLQFDNNPQHAERMPMAVEHPLVGAGLDTYSVASGERPLWEFGPVSTPVPLGDVAREFRKEKLTAKKAQITFEKQGS
jgi:hypothetical protein